MATYDVIYVGQLRFVECVDLHKKILKNAKNIYGVFVKDIQDIYKINLGTSYSVNGGNSDFDSALDYFKKSTGCQDITIVNDEIFKDQINIQTVTYFISRRFLLLSNYIKNTDSDFTIVLSSDCLIDPFNIEENLKSLSKIKDPCMFVDSYIDLNEPNFLSFNVHFSIINKKGILNLKKNWKNSFSKFLGEIDKYPLRVETTWALLTDFCEIKNQYFELKIPVQLFRANMDFDTILASNPNIDSYVKRKQDEWRSYKDYFCKHFIKNFNFKNNVNFVPYTNYTTYMINNNLKTWCYNAFHSLSASNAGTVRPCCMYTGHLDIPPLGQSTIQENFTNRTLIKIRQELESGIRSTGCSKCWQEEDGGRKSKRIRDNKTYVKRLQSGKVSGKGLEYLELNLGNHCNIKCRTCAPYASSQWLKEDYEVNWMEKISFNEYSKQFQQYSSSFADESPFWTDLKNNLPTVKRLDFYGGEPFLSKKMWNVLEYATAKGFAGQIELHYATNGTIFKDNFKDIFRNFKAVNILFSIDGINNSFEYMRYMAKWSEVYENMNKMESLRLELPNINLSWCITLSTLNIFLLPEILTEHQKSFKNFGCYLNLVHTPKHFNISFIPDIYKPAIVSRLEHAQNLFPKFREDIEGIKGFILTGKEDIAQWDKFLEIVRKHDIYRKQNYAEVFPFFAKLINYQL